MSDLFPDDYEKFQDLLEKDAILVCSRTGQL